MAKLIKNVKIKKVNWDKILTKEVVFRLSQPAMPYVPTPKQENVSAVVGLLVVAIVFIIGINIGLFVANFLKEPTWHSPNGCALQVLPTK